MMPRKTDRLRFERLSVEHASLLFALHSDPEVMRYIRAPDQTIADTEKTLAELLPAFAGGDLGIFPAFAGEAFVGWGVLAHLERNPTFEVEVGYRLHVAQWGKGYATEIARELVRFGFEDLGLTRIVAITHPENVKSQRVIEKLGFGYEGERYFYKSSVRYYAGHKVT